MRSARRIFHLIPALFTTLVLSWLGDVAHAEYRVFELAITDTVTSQSRIVKSTLDDIQYPMYFHLRRSEKITIQSSWMCWTRSDISQDPSQRYCPNPRAPASVAPPTPPSPSS